MEEQQLKVEIILSRRTCPRCGIVWAIQNTSRAGNICPCCISGSEEMDRLQTQLRANEKRLSSLRGIVTKLRKEREHGC